MAGDEFPEDSELGSRFVRGPVIIRNGNSAANRIVWWVAGTVVVMLFALQGWIDVLAIDDHTKVAVLESEKAK
jgi:hypothetical protein